MKSTSNSGYLCVVMFLLLSIVCSTPALWAKPPATVGFIVRFEVGVSREQAEARIKKAGGKTVSVLSAERNTYQAAAISVEECNKAIKILGEDKQVVFAEIDGAVSVNQH